jgi:hypothetical protein
MFQTICEQVPREPRLPMRAWQLDCLYRVLDGTIYDVLRHPFHEERKENGEYVPIRKRKPSVRYGLCRSVVADSVSLLFGEGHFPSISVGDNEVNPEVTRLIRDIRLPQVMLDAATRGSVGSVAIRVRLIEARVYLDVMETRFLTPIWRANRPDTLEKVVEAYIVMGEDLEARGYTGVERKVQYWFKREWTDIEEVWYLPLSTADYDDKKPFVRDEDRTVRHDHGFVPIVWIRNLPGGTSTGDPAEGASTFSGAIDSQMEIEYQLSQAGRGLKYSSDPTLLLKDPTALDEPGAVKAPNMALVVSKDGDGKLLEITGNALHAVMEYVRIVRELALESIHGNRSSADKINAAQSGKAMELLHQPLIWLADKLRLSYGEYGILAVLRMIAVMHKASPIELAYGTLGEMPKPEDMSLRWAPYFFPTFQDQLEQANGLSIARKAGILSQKTGVKVLATTHDIENVETEISDIEADQKYDDARAARNAELEKAQRNINQSAT